ncbi:hypothetical protein IVB22_33125 [Bradyrhizobium sp. 190]|uniref:hypothetical protein n=1 Tax=Bradyrhizobium sp. 190 TaxID=2782658 RepID=UPI001FF7C85E|nr:hypothetical protein [Bradyrhizobium sp. 190]MCK1517263.1 hypothetical protein [Bradyrhizobium sp. 190]
MPIFVLLPQNEPAQRLLPAAVAREFPDAHKPLANNNWLVAGKGTAQDISAKLGITNPKEPTSSAIGTVMVLEVGSYYGRAASDVWDWIKAKWEATSG